MTTQRQRRRTESRPSRTDRSVADIAPPRGGSSNRPPLTHEVIARRAYELYLERGGDHGRDQEDWFRATHALDQHAALHVVDGLSDTSARDHPTACTQTVQRWTAISSGPSEASMMYMRDDRYQQSDPTPLTTDGEDLRLAAQSRVTVMVTAHSSRDREACARFIHALGCCPERPFVRVNCGAGARSTLSAAMLRNHGCLEDAADLHSRFEQARGGTLFIDDIGRMNAALQHQLLARLEQQVLRPPEAGAQPAGFATRVIAAATRPLGGAIASGAFSESLFYRLNTVHIDLTDPRHMEER